MKDSGGLTWQLRLCAPTAEDAGSTPDWGTKFLYAAGRNQKGKITEQNRAI